MVSASGGAESSSTPGSWLERGPGSSGCPTAASERGRLLKKPAPRGRRPEVTDDSGAVLSRPPGIAATAARRWRRRSRSRRRKSTLLMARRRSGCLVGGPARAEAGESRSSSAAAPPDPPDTPESPDPPEPSAEPAPESPDDPADSSSATYDRRPTAAGFRRGPAGGPVVPGRSRRSRTRTLMAGVAGESPRQEEAAESVRGYCCSSGSGAEGGTGAGAGRPPEAEAAPSAGLATKRRPECHEKIVICVAVNEF